MKKKLSLLMVALVAVAAFAYQSTRRAEAEAIVISPESGDIYTAFAAATEGKTIGDVTINLKAGVEYTLSNSIVVPGNLTINGNGATIDASGNTGDIISLQGSTQYVLLGQDGEGANVYDTSHFDIGEVTLKNVNIAGIKGSLIRDNQKTLLGTLTIENSIIEMPASNKQVINFSSKGYIGNVVVFNSTIYSKGVNSGYFVQYGSRPNNLPEAYRANFKQLFDIQNSTFVNIAKGQNFCNFSQKGTANNGYTVKNDIFVDCGKTGQVIQGINSNQKNATPAWDVTNNVFNWGGEDVSTTEASGTSASYVLNSIATVVAFADAANGDFTLEYGSAANTAKVGDPRWISYSITPASVDNGTIATTPAGSAIAGAEVTITNEPAAGYELKPNTYKVTYMDGETEKTVDVKDGKFIMPAAAVTVKAEFWLIPEDITVNMDAAGNINEALTAAIGTKNPKNIAINLKAAGTYPVTATIATMAGLNISGVEGAVIDASNLESEFIKLTGSVVKAKKSDDTESTFLWYGDIIVKDVAISKIKKSLVKTTETARIDKILVENSVVEYAAQVNVFELGSSFYTDLTIEKSTIWATTETNHNKYLIKCDGRCENLEKVNNVYPHDVTTSIINSTLYNIARGQKLNNSNGHMKGKTYNVQKLENSILVNTGTNVGNEVNGWMFGSNSTNMKMSYKNNTYITLDAEDNVANVTGWTNPEKGGSDQSGTAMTINPGISYAKAEAGTFAIASVSPQALIADPEATPAIPQAGDPRWGTWLAYTISAAEGIEHGKVATDLPYAAAGTQVTVVPTPDETYKLKFGSVAVTYKDGEETKNVEVSFDNKFTMPAAAVTVTAAFERVPVDIEVVAADITEGDLTAAIAAKSKAVTDVNDVVGNITVTLDGETAYKVTAPIDGAKSVVINGNGAKIDASALEDAFVKMRETPIIDPNEKGAYPVDGIVIKDVEINALAQSLVDAKGAVYYMKGITIENSVINVSGNKHIIDFQSKGLAEVLSIKNSTLWASDAAKHTGRLYQQQSGKKPAEIGAEQLKVSITNSTLYNISNNQNYVGYYRENSKAYHTFEVLNSVIVNCGASGYFLRGLNQKQQGANANWNVEGNVINYCKGFIVEQTVGKSAETIKNPIPAIAVFADADNGDFNVNFAKDPKADLVVAGVGDPRWTIGATTDAKSVNVAETIEHATVTVDKAFSLEDEIVTITVVPEQGYSVAKMYAKVGNTPIKVECKEKDKTYTFTMPAMNVTVSADMEIVATDFVINVESGSITDAINKEIKYTEGEEVKTKNIKSLTINLKNAGVYTITESIVSPGYVVINGKKDAIIDASGLKQISGEGEETTTTYLPLITLDGTTVQAKNADGTENANYKSVEKVTIKDVTITGLANAIVKDAQKTLLDKIEIENSVIELVGKNNVFDFNGKGYPADVTINKSTLWSKEGHTGYFIQTSGRVKDLDNAQTTYKQILTITNSTLSQIAVGKKMNNYQGKGQKSLVFTLTNNILNNVGSSEGNEINGFLGGQNSTNPTVTYENNTYWSAEGNVAGWTDATKQGSDQSGTALLFNPYLKDAANGDFAIGYKTEQAEKKTGDQRWGTWENTVFTITVAEMEGGTIVAPATAEAEDEIQLIAKPAEGFRLKAGSVYGMMGKSVFEISDDLTFYMPVTDVTIYAEFEPVYAVNIAEGIENGTVKADVTEAGAGDIVTLTITPAEGYELDAISVRGVTSDIAVEVVDGKFTMPADAVTVNATFKSTTGINSVKADALENAVIYNMQGVRVDKAQAKGGVFIVNGKKTVIK